MVKKGIVSLMLLLLGIFSSCINDTWYSCDNCYTTKPVVGLLEIRLSPGLTNPRIPVAVYQKEKHRKNLYLRDTVSELNISYWVPVGYHYIAEASYRVSGQTIIVTDRDRVDLYFDESECDEPCWRPIDGKLDCRLKAK